MSAHPMPMCLVIDEENFGLYNKSSLHWFVKLSLLSSISTP